MAGLNTGILRVVSNQQMVEDEQKQAERELAERQNTPVMLGMTGYIRSCWDAARNAKQVIERQMLMSMRQRNGEYEADKLAAINKAGGSTIYMMVTEVKCRAAESWLRDILMDQGSPPWDISPTPLPELDPSIKEEIQNIFADALLKATQQSQIAPTAEEQAQLKETVEQDFRMRMLQEAQNRANRMKTKIDDQLTEGGWLNAFDAFVTDLVTFPAAFIKGPVVRRQRVLGWAVENGRTVPKPIERLAPEFERVDPFRIYPEPGITDINDGYIFQHHPMTRSTLADLIGVPGYDDDAIRQALEYGATTSWFISTVEAQKADQEKKFQYDRSPNKLFDVLEFWGKVSGRMLREWGMSEQDIPDEAREYDANVWICGNYILKAVLNYDPLGEKPYVKANFIKIPGAFWGRGIPEVIADIQNVCNAAARAMVNNMGIASGPQVEVNVERLPPNEDVTALHPWKIWQVLNDPAGVNAPAIRFEQPDDRSAQLMAVYERFSRLADDHSGIPAYVHGDTDVQGAGRTASGLSMLMGSAGKGIRQVVMHIDNDVIKPMIQRQFVFNMRYDDDESIKGDCQIVAKGAVNLAVKETVNMRRVEFLNATANPIDVQIMGPGGRAAVLREVAKGLQMPEEEVVPTREKFLLQQAAAPPPSPVPPGAGTAPGAKATPTEVGGAPMGGMDTNLVSNRVS